MKTVFTRFVGDQTGAISFEDGLIFFALTIGFIVALAVLNIRFVQFYAAVSDMLPGYH